MKRSQNEKNFSILISKQTMPILLYITAALCSIVSMFFNKWLGIAEFVIIAVIFIIEFLKKRKNNYKEMLEIMMSHLDVTAKDSILNTPIPVCVVDSEGNILWYNDLFAEITSGIEIDYGSNIKNICPAFNNDVFETRNDSSAKINDKLFHVYQNIINTEDFESLFMMYWIDVTKFKKIEKTYADTRPAIGYIVIDNYNELMENAKEAEQALIAGMINDTLISWAKTNKSIIQRISKMRYIMYMEYTQLEEYINGKFVILDEIRAINHITKMPATISIGIGFGGKTLEETENFAKQSLDMSLGRGGDQAVIKNQNGFEFYGGKNKIVEKRTKVRSRIIANALSELFASSSNIIIMGHKYADLDAMGSAIGIAKAVKISKKEAYIIINEDENMCDEMIQKFKKFDDYKETFIDAQEAILKVDKNTLLIIVDTHTPTLVESMDLYETCQNVVVIDHHRRSANYIERAIISYHETFASSTCEMVAELIEHIAPDSLNKTEAEAIMAGIMLDTKNFSMRTGVRTFEAASYLKKMGADTMEAKKYFRGGLESYEAKSRIVSNAEVYHGNIAIASAQDDIKLHDIKTLAAQAADDLLTIAGIEASFVLFKTDGEVSVSGRSLGEINVQLICEKLGGGGHYQMAGAQIEGDNTAKVCEMLKKAIDEVLD